MMLAARRCSCSWAVAARARSSQPPHAMSAAAAAATHEGHHSLADGSGIAYRLTNQPAAAAAPGAVIFIHGLCSNMLGTKAAALEEHARREHFPFLCFDARGHGSSSGAFQDTHIGQWLEDAETALCRIAPPGRHILVGSSLGGWLALQLAVTHPERVAGLLLVAPALDFTERIWAGLSEQQQAAAAAEGRIRLDSNYMEPVYASLALIEQGRRLLMLERLPQLQVACPVRILHGCNDEAVPVAIGRRLFEELASCADMHLTLVKGGDHRLARPQDLATLLGVLDGLRATAWAA